MHIPKTTKRLRESANRRKRRPIEEMIIRGLFGQVQWSSLNARQTRPTLIAERCLLLGCLLLAEFSLVLKRSLSLLNSSNSLGRGTFTQKAIATEVALIICEVASIKRLEIQPQGCSDSSQQRVEPSEIILSLVPSFIRAYLSIRVERSRTLFKLLWTSLCRYAYHRDSSFPSVPDSFAAKSFRATRSSDSKRSKIIKMIWIKSNDTIIRKGYPIVFWFRKIFTHLDRLTELHTI